MSYIIYNLGFLLLLLSFILPGNGILGIDVSKIINIYIFIVTLLLIYKKRVILKLDRKFLVFIYLFLTYLIFSMLIAIYNGNELIYIILQMYDFIVIILKIVFSFYYIQYNKKSNNKINIIKTLYIFMVIKILCKLVFELYSYKMGFSPLDISELYNKLFIVKIMSQNIDPINILRIDTVNDVLPFYVFLFYLYDNNSSKIKKMFMSILMALYVFIIYSRIFIAFYIFSLIVILIHKNIINLRKKNVIFLILGCILILCSLYKIQDTKIYNQINIIMEERFNSNDSKYSDSIREKQKFYLEQEIFKKPILGMGLGGYSKNIIRSESKYYYELEYLSLMMQLGILGFIVFVIGMFIFILYIANKFINEKYSFIFVPILLAMIFQFIKMLTNPFFGKIPVLFLVIFSFCVNYKVLSLKKV